MLELRADTVAALFELAERARPREAVAALLVDDEGAEALYPLENAAAGDDGFELTVEATAWLVAAGHAETLELVFFHSHPDAACYPSRGDLRHADEGSRHLILSLRSSELRLFRYVANDDDRLRGRLRAREEPVVVTLPDAASDA